MGIAKRIQLVANAVPHFLELFVFLPQLAVAVVYGTATCSGRVLVFVDLRQRLRGLLIIEFEEP